MNHTDFKADFPIFTHFEGLNEPFFYLDSAATSQTPASVIDEVALHEESRRANVHRGIYRLSEAATQAYEGSRTIISSFLNAALSREIVFVRNTTEGINLAAAGLGGILLRPGDRILVSRAEHHSNFLPWQRLAKEKDLALDIVDPDEEGMISTGRIEALIRPTTRLAAFSHISHVLGSINPVKEMGQLFRERGIFFLLDAAQSVAHMPIDVQEIGCDALVFSGHKMGGPSGIGVLYMKGQILASMEPLLVGGGMVHEVSSAIATWAEHPWKFEAGTPNISGAVGLAAASRYLAHVGFPVIRGIDERVMKAIIGRLNDIPGMRIFGPSDIAKRGGVLSFTVGGLHPHDLATVLDRSGVCIRAGHHCAMPLMQHLGIAAAVRASTWLYNNEEDAEALAQGIERAAHIIKKSFV